jgi:hypothetical protein
VISDDHPSIRQAVTAELHWGQLAAVRGALYAAPFRAHVPVYGAGCGGRGAPGECLWRGGGRTAESLAGGSLSVTGHRFKRAVEVFAQESGGEP